MIRFEDIEDKVRQNYPGEDLSLLKKAYVFSAKEHVNQFRMSGEPYLAHPLEVSNILADLGLDVVTVTVGLLHDVVEDTLVNIETIEKMFGPETAALVDGVTKISQIPFSSTEHKQAENFRKLLLAMSNDLKVILVKLADRLHNMRTLQYLSPEKRIRISLETMDIYAPISNRLGMGRMKGELEDLAFMYLEPERYRETIAMIEKRRGIGEKFIKEVEKQLMHLVSDENIPLEIESRMKRVHSIHSKMMRMRIPFEKVYDFVAIRCITDTLPQCYSLLGIVHNAWKLIPGRFKDYISMPRPNGYQSIHTTLISEKGFPFEVQIRTREMHRRAEEGIAAHWKYKQEHFPDQQTDLRFSWLQNLLEWQQEVQDPHEFISNLKVDLFPQEVYIFSPKGDVITLPQGATPVDFAFAIHTEIGHRCYEAKVNGTTVPLDYHLQNGEIVEIATSKEKSPSRGWLQFVRTSKARNHIRQWLKKREKKEYADLGKKILEKETARRHLTVKDIESSSSFVAELKRLDLSDLSELHRAIGIGRLKANEFVQGLFPEESAPGDEQERPESIKDKMLNVFRKDDSFIIQGHNDAIADRASCCNPIPGEAIIGVFSPGKGIIVHSRYCAGLQTYTPDSELLIDVHWGKVNRDVYYTVVLEVQCDDRKGMIADISNRITKFDVNIRNFQAETNQNNYGLFLITLEVIEMKQLEKVIRTLSSLKNVYEVNRVDNRKSGEIREDAVTSE